MKFKTLTLYICLFLFFSACEVKWDMKLEINEDYSGNYSIGVLIDQEAQIYALETGQSSIGGLDLILSNLPEGFGSSIYQDGDFLGILVRNSFTDSNDLFRQFELLKSEENTALLVLPIEEIKIETSENEINIFGTFAEIFVSDDESIEGFKRIFDGRLIIKVPGNIKEPKLDNIIDNTIIFENDGLSVKTFNVVTNLGQSFQYVWLILILFMILSLFVRQQLKKK